MADPLIDRIDDAVGAIIERGVRTHHRRRLRRVGWEHAFGAGPGWAAGDPPPRAGNALEVLVDGAEALPRIEEAIESARESVLLAGWTFTPSFHLRPDGPSLRELLAETAERAEVRVLAWAGAPLPLFTPSRKDVRRMAYSLADGTRIRIGLDAHERPMHCHHEKALVVDGRVAFVGGIDLTSLAGNRFDHSDHPARGETGWHDASARIEGPLVADVHDHLALRWHEVVGERLPDAPSNSLLQGRVEAQLVRTVPEHVYDALPRGDFRILESYVGALRGAERLVYLESQFLWSPELVELLAEKLRRPPCDEFRLVVVLPARPNNGADDTRGQLGVLVDADAGAGRFLACTLYQPGHADQVYVHAKIGVVDDRWLALGSANLNEHSLFNDTELCVVTHDEALARATRLRLWREHLERDDVDGAPHTVVDELWRPLAENGLARRTRGEPIAHRLARLPHVSRRTRRFLGPVNSLVVDG
jgi:phosphatidylserine/phosphatidylglycerophosphate/cardiolipin synthase-like enzyme